jgi:putative toxin-antitoxin system antitoxin component (TIGR02293 family)
MDKMRGRKMLVAPGQIAQVLGGKENLGTEITTSSDLERAIVKGLPSSLVSLVVEKIYPQQKEKSYQLIPRTTLTRKLVANQPLSVEESQKLERLARVYALALEVWIEPESARDFLTRSHPMLDARTPFEACLTELGARQVEEILGRILFGSAA